MTPRPLKGPLFRQVRNYVGDSLRLLMPGGWEWRQSWGNINSVAFDEFWQTGGGSRRPLILGPMGDTPHRWRSVREAVWQSVAEPVCEQIREGHP